MVKNVDWIDCRDEMPEMGTPVLVALDYRLSEYGVSFAIGRRVQFHGTKNPRWECAIGKMFTGSRQYTRSPMESMTVHAIYPGDGHVTHWMPLVKPGRGIHDEAL